MSVRSSARPQRPALRYFGSKWRIAPWIISQFPEHECYVEPFMGSAAVLLRKPPSPIEYLNDLDGEVVNFFRVLRDRYDDFVRSVQLTPFSRQELELAYEPADEPLERARRFFVRCWQGRSGSLRHRTGWRSQIRLRRGRNRSALDFHNLDADQAQPRDDIAQMIERGDYTTVLRRFDAPSTLCFVDPPYLGSLRGSSSRYAHELRSTTEHEQLAEQLLVLQGMVVLSGYPSQLYAEIFESAGWARRDRQVRLSSGRAATESIWLNPSCLARQRQGRLFQEAT